jgi:hypothetical protein
VPLSFSITYCTLSFTSSITSQEEFRFTILALSINVTHSTTFTTNNTLVTNSFVFIFTDTFVMTITVNSVHGDRTFSNTNIVMECKLTITSLTNSSVRTFVTTIRTFFTCFLVINEVLSTWSFTLVYFTCDTPITILNITSLSTNVVTRYVS